MGKEKVEIIFGAEDREILRALNKQNQLLDKQMQKLQKVGDTSQRAASQQKRGLDSVSVSALKIAASYASIVPIITSITSANQKMFETAKEVAHEYDDIFRKLQVQAGLTDLQRDEAQKRIGGIAERLAVPVREAGTAATQLVSSGFSSDQASGEALVNFLKLTQATNQSGQGTDPTQLAKAIAQFLTANDITPNGKDLLAVGKNLHALFMATNIQLTDLTPLAEAAGATAGRMTFPEQFATQALLTESFGAEKSATAQRNFVQRIESAKSSPAKIKALEKIGLTPQQVDFIGEDFMTVLNTLGEAIEKAGPETRNEVLPQIFGGESLPFVNKIIDQRAKIRKLVGQQNNPAGFNQALNSSSSGINAASVRQNARGEVLALEYYDGGDLFEKELDNVGLELGYSPFKREYQKRVFQTVRGFGFSPKHALGAATALSFTEYDSLYKDVQKNVAGQLQSTATDDTKTILLSIDNSLKSLNGKAGGSNTSLDRIRTNTEASNRKPAIQNIHALDRRGRQ